MVDTKDLIELKEALNEAIKTSKRLDKIHKNYVERTQSGFSRAATTTYNANSASLTSNLKSEIDTVKELAKKSLGL